MSRGSNNREVVRERAFLNENRGRSNANRGRHFLNQHFSRHDNELESPPRNACVMCGANLEETGIAAFDCPHLICRPCIAEYERENGDRTCPICGEDRTDVPVERRRGPGADDEETVPPSGNQNLIARRAIPSAETRCVICMRPGSQVPRGRLHCCDHFFCFDDILQAASRNPSCPVCRQAFHQIEIEYPHGWVGTRFRTIHQNKVYDLALRSWIDPPNGPPEPEPVVDIRNFRPQVDFGPRDDNNPPRVNQCALCEGTRGELRECRSCHNYIHFVCADPIWHPLERQWLCAACVNQHGPMRGRRG